MATRSQTAKPPVKRAEQPSTVRPVAASATTKPARTMTMLHITRNTDARHFIHCYEMDFADKIRVIRAGVPAQLVGELSSVMDMPKEALMASLGLSRATINRKVQRAQALSPEESERVMGMQALIGQVQSMIAMESVPDFDAAKWLATWLAAPLPALGGATPASFMDTVEGQKYVGNLLEMTQSGAYA